jgi:hypothetical protein
MEIKFLHYIVEYLNASTFDFNRLSGQFDGQKSKSSQNFFERSKLRVKAVFEFDRRFDSSRKRQLKERFQDFAKRHRKYRTFSF